MFMGGSTTKTSFVGSSDLICNHDAKWVTSFLTYNVFGDALKVEIMNILHCMG